MTPEDLDALIKNLEDLDELQDTSALEDMSPTYFEVPGPLFHEALRQLRAFLTSRE